MKIVPSFHPAYILRTADWPAISLLASDLRRALRESWMPTLKRLPTRYITHPTAVEMREFLRVGDARPLTLDIETAGLEDNAAITMCGVARVIGSVACLPWNATARGMLAAALRDPSSPKVAHNSPFDFPRLARVLGINRVEGEWRDTAAAWSLLEPDIKPRGEKYSVPLGLLGSLYWDGGYLWKEEQKAGRMDTETYCCTDVDVTARAMDAMEDKLKILGMWGLFRKSVMPGVKTCIAMGERGIRIDRKRMLALRDKLQERVDGTTSTLSNVTSTLPTRIEVRDALLRDADQVDAAAHQRELEKRGSVLLCRRAAKLRKQAEAFADVNLASTKQLAKLLYHELGLPIQHKHLPGRQQGPVTTDDDAMLELLRVCGGNPKFVSFRPIVEAIREHRELAKAIGTNLNYDSAIVHPRLLVWVASTGRLSCVEPNLQNIPVRREYAKELRRIYKPRDEGNVFSAFDYNQIELRVAAWLSQEPKLLEAFAAGRDIHQETADRYGFERYPTKRARYGWLYGIGYMKLQRTLAADGYYMTPSKVKQILTALDADTPMLTRWRDRIVAEATREHVLRNPFKRLRWFYEPRPYSAAISFTPQSTAADVVLQAMNQMNAELPKGAYLVLQIHDELLVEHPPELAQQVTECARDIMEAPIDEMDGWRCPVSLKSGPSLGELC